MKRLPEWIGQPSFSAKKHLGISVQGSLVTQGCAVRIVLRNL